MPSLPHTAGTFRLFLSGWRGNAAKYELFDHIGTIKYSRRSCSCERCRNIKGDDYIATGCGCSSEAERQLPKLNVVGSIPITRSTNFLSATQDIAGLLPGSLEESSAHPA